MGVFRNFFSSDPALAVEHLFGVHNFDPQASPVTPANNFSPAMNSNDLQINASRLQQNPQFSSWVPKTMPTMQPIPNATPGQMPTMAPLPNADPYQQYLQQLPNNPAPGLPTPPPDLRQAVTRAGQEQGVPPSILYGISGAESVNPHSMQWQNARGADQHGQGYFQFDNRYYPQTGQFNPYNPYQAATKAAQKFKGDVNYFQSNPQAGMSPVEAAMRAYNAGRGGHLSAPTPTQDYNRFTQYAGANK